MKVFQYCLLAFPSSHHLPHSLQLARSVSSLKVATAETLQPVWDVKENSMSAVCSHFRQMSKKRQRI